MGINADVHRWQQTAEYRDKVNKAAALIHMAKALGLPQSDVEASLEAGYAEAASTATSARDLACMRALFRESKRLLHEAYATQPRDPWCVGDVLEC